MGGESNFTIGAVIKLVTMANSTSCLNDVRWRNADATPNEEYLKENDIMPQVGEARWVLVGNDVTLVEDEHVWLLHQPEMAYQNGWETQEEIEASAVVLVKVMQGGKPPRKKNYWEQVWFWAQVQCEQVVPLHEIPNIFSQSEPSYWPEENRQVHRFDLGRIIYYWIIREAVRDWFLLTPTNPPRMVLRSQQVQDEPIEICNCPFNEEAWPHHLYKRLK